ncbi:hypothetical protein [Mycobacterium sp. E1747]|uniref:hypothetical protein n=1 Tax=Mycobacterium sp. E1747 TaxID=1834128 RepID=UPI0007FC3617|nr:hypothetical protein [Mycobacterium sp. E1747]OBH08953.1 hypothetical protein A5695_25290 [Mycobacterium sp. E1747]
MAERPVEVEWAVENDCDVTLTISMTVDGGANLDLLIPYIKDELQTLAHDTFKQHWHWRPGDQPA